MRRLIFVVLLLSSIVSASANAAIFRLQDVIVGTFPTLSDQISHPYVEIGGWIEYDGPFRSSSTLTNFDLTSRLLGTDRAYTLLTPPYFVPVPGGVCECGREQFSTPTMTTFNFFTPSTGVKLEFGVGQGVEVDHGVIPLLPLSFDGENFRIIFQSDVMLGGYRYPILSGWLKVEPSESSVPEPGSSVLFLSGLGAVGLLIGRRRTAIPGLK